MIKKSLVLFLLSSLFIFASFAQTITPIADIQDNLNNWEGQSVSIEGIVTVSANTHYRDRLQVYVQDESGKGIQIWRSGAPDASLTEAFRRGNRVRVSGTVSVFSNMPQIQNFTFVLIDQNNTVPYVELSIAEARNHARWRGTFAKVSGNVWQENRVTGSGASAGTDVYIEDDIGVRIVVRVWTATNINVNRIRVGMPLEVFGAIGIFSNVGQVMPAYQSDLIINIPEPQIENITFSPTPTFVHHDITIRVNIFDYRTQVDSVWLQYRTGTQTEFRDGRIWFRGPAGTDNYQGSIPSFDSIKGGSDGEEGDIIFRIIAQNTDGHRGTSREITINVTKPRPLISNIQTIAGPQDTLIVRANIEAAGDDRYMREAWIYYTLNFSSKVEDPIEMRIVSGNMWEGVLPMFPGGTIVNVSVWAADNTGVHSIKNTADSGETLRYIFPVRTTQAILRIAPRAYNIYEGDTIDIGFFAKQGDQITMRIFNSEGKLVTTPVNRTASANDGVNFHTWDGRNRDFRLVEPGLYICHIEVIDIKTGRKKIDRAPIVIGTRLGR
jgi:DNA/RNA endonuclease YhcR with UshA esterase domain